MISDILDDLPVSRHPTRARLCRRAIRAWRGIADGQKLTPGDTTVTLHHTPGHTPGSVSPIYPARWQGREHAAMLWGGTNPPAATADKETYLSSILTFASRLRRAGVDAEVSNHAFSDSALPAKNANRAAP